MYRSYWSAPGLSTANADLFAHSLHAFVGTRRRHRSTAKMNGATAVSSGPPAHPVYTLECPYRQHDARARRAWLATSSNWSVRRLEVIEEIGPGLAFMPKHHAAGTQRCPGQRHALELTSLFDSQFV